MICKSLLPKGLFTIILTIIGLQLYAQPQLPDIAGTTTKGVNILTWTCQYDGIKSIAVQRSRDSAYSYATVGYVKNTKKGVQVFLDGHPAAGNNWYQLYIVFNSDLTWISNKIKLHIDSATLENQTAVLPPNDSLQKLIVADKNGPSIKTGGKGHIVVVIDSTKNMVSSQTSTSASSAEATKPRITISMEGGDVNPYNYIRSRYIYTNPLNGHVNMEVPEPNRYHYSIKFFDQNNKQVLDVPRIPTSPVILDKRNFERKGLYKFVLKRDSRELETGYITIF